MTEEKLTRYFKNEVFFQHPVTDFDRSIPFYKKLGLEVSQFSEEQDNYDEIGIFEFNLPVEGAILSLGKVAKENLKPLDSLAISVTDLVEVERTLKNQEISTNEIVDVPGLLSFLSIKDPDGNEIVFVSDPRV